MNAPIPVSEALKLLSMALEDCDKASEREWPAYEPEDDDGPEVAVFVRFSFLARATMRPMLEYFKRQADWVAISSGEFAPDDWAYPPLAALMAHYDATRPDWRTR